MKTPTLYFNVGGYSIALPRPGQTTYLVVCPFGETRLTSPEVRVLLDLEDGADIVEYLLNQEDETEEGEDWKVGREGLGVEIKPRPLEVPFYRTFKPVAFMDARESWRTRSVEHCLYDGGFSSDCTMPKDDRPDIAALASEGRARALIAHRRMGFHEE